MLHIFKSLALIFEQKEPSVYRLFDEWKYVVWTIFSCFIKLKNVKSLSSKKLAKLDVKDLNYQLPICEWFVGSKTKELWSLWDLPGFFFLFLFLASYNLIVWFYSEPLNFSFLIAIENIENLFVLKYDQSLN